MDKRNREDVGMDTGFKEEVKGLIHYLDILKKHGFSEENAIQIMILLYLKDISDSLSSPYDGLGGSICQIVNLLEHCIDDNGMITVCNID